MLIGKLSGKVALVTGSARGQGRSHALGLAREGARVVLSDICQDIPEVPYPLASRKELENVASEARKLGAEVHVVEADISSSAQVKQMVDEAVSVFGKIDILVANAGIYSYSTIESLDDKTWNRVIDVNLNGTFYCNKYSCLHMIKRKYGRIVNVSSLAGFLGAFGGAHYAAAKHGIIGLTRSLALELAPYGITVNAVCPAFVETDMLRGVEREIAKVGAKSEIPQSTRPPPVLRPEDVTGAVLWLVSDEASRVSGVTLPIDMGYSVA